MPNDDDTVSARDSHDHVCLMDGSSSAGSYAVVAKRGSIFLGIKFVGSEDGTLFGMPGTTYLRMRIRSAKSAKLSSQISGDSLENVVHLAQPQLTPADAWPSVQFDKTDPERASVVIGLFVQGSLAEDPAAVLAHLRKRALFSQLVAYAMERAGPENCIASQETVVDWLMTQAQPAVRELEKSIVVQQASVLALKEFATQLAGMEQVVAPHRQALRAIFQKHVNECLLALRTGGPASQRGIEVADQA